MNKVFFHLEEYQPEWLLPPESEIAQWFQAKVS
jgi:hypothetical protein